MDYSQETYSYQNHVNRVNHGLQDKDCNIKNWIQIRISITPEEFDCDKNICLQLPIDKCLIKNISPIKQLKIINQY